MSKIKLELQNGTYILRATDTEGNQQAIKHIVINK